MRLLGKVISSPFLKIARQAMVVNGGETSWRYCEIITHPWGCLGLRNGDEITSATMHHSFRPPLPDLKSQKHQNSLVPVP
jgi:hypothetical protein